MNLKLVLKYGLIFSLIVLFACNETKRRDETTVKEIMDNVVTRLYKTKSQSELASLTYDQAMHLFTPKEMHILGTRHWMFDVNVPAVVSVMRSTEQKVVPFWLKENGFQKTDMTLKNEMTTYEVWQKKFEPGRVGLGINGFANYSLHYFVCVGPQNKNDKLVLSHFFPENQYVGTMEDGAFTYHDWDELVLMDVPKALQGQKLLTTIRGRGVETHLVGAFRKTEYPSSATPDQVMLTWSSSPSTTMDIQWRTDTTVENGEVRYREEGSSKVFTTHADKYKMEDRLLMNDRFDHRFTAQLQNLKPGTTYQYQIAPATNWNKNYTFTTSDNSDSFSFIWFGDTHHSPDWGKIANMAFESHPDAAFYSIAGDLVSEGLHRDHWDDLFEFSKNIICQRPLMSVVGNHDTRLGLGSKMYRDLFSYPKNGPDGVPKENTYSFTYKNALFLMIDATAPIDDQTEWIEDQLKNSNATWKFAEFHFPPYNWEEPYYGIQKAWVPLFDKYHVDMVFSGHIHYYMRSKPMKAGKVVDSYNDGTAYIISIGIPSKTENYTDEPYAEVRKMEGQYYQYLTINGKHLTYSAFDSNNHLVDSFKIDKK